MVLAYAYDRVDWAPATYPLLEARSLEKVFGGRKVVNDLSFKISKGEIIGFFGKKDVCKSIVISLISGEILPTSGQIIFQGRDIKCLPFNERQELGIRRVPPVSSLYDDLSVRDNFSLLSEAVCRPLYPRQGNGCHFQDMRHFLNLVTLGSSTDRIVKDLPHTEQVLLTIAIALSSKPSLLLFEDTGLDSRADHSGLNELLAIIADEGASVVLTAEQLYPTINICDRVAVLQGGAIVEDYCPNCY